VCGEDVTKLPFDIESALNTKIGGDDIFMCLVSENNMTKINGEVAIPTTVQVPSVGVTDISVMKVIEHLTRARLSGVYHIIVYSDISEHRSEDQNVRLLFQSKIAKSIQRNVSTIFKFLGNIYTDKGTVLYDKTFNSSPMKRIIDVTKSNVEDFYDNTAMINGVKLWSRNKRMIDQINTVKDCISSFTDMINLAKENGNEADPFTVFTSLMSGK
jgi:hypothetical protein